MTHRYVIVFVLQIMYLGAASNNMALTILAFFQESVDKFAVPLRLINIINLEIFEKKNRMIN